MAPAETSVKYLSVRPGAGITEVVEGGPVC